MAFAIFIWQCGNPVHILILSGLLIFKLPADWRWLDNDGEDSLIGEDIVIGKLAGDQF
jgi:hypothetical protein